MLFSSSVFLMVFLPLTLLVYFLIPGRFVMARNTALLIASLVFYGWGEPKYILVMLVSILANYVLAIAIGKFRGESNTSMARVMLILDILVNLGLLGFFKYTDFIIETVNSLSGADLDLLGIALPIGISFYTFQTMSYVIDVYRGKVESQKNIITLATYITLFPQLIAGPIVRYSDVEVQLRNRTSDLERITEGIKRFVIGFAKKVLIANQMAVIWEEIYAMVEGGENPGAALVWMGAVAFTFQIYFDFSGYSDMAIGLGKILGFDYLENFDHPIFIVWALTGLWHGASWNFVVWGVYYGVLLIIEKLFLLKLLDKLPEKLVFIKHVYTLFFVILGWVIFNITDFSVLGKYIALMFGAGTGNAAVTMYYLKSRAFLMIAAAVCSLPLLKKIDELMDKKLMFYTTKDMVETFVLLILFIMSVAFLVSGSYNPFLYFRF